MKVIFGRSDGKLGVKKRGRGGQEGKDRGSPKWMSQGLKKKKGNRKWNISIRERRRIRNGIKEEKTCGG